MKGGKSEIKTDCDSFVCNSVLYTPIKSTTKQKWYEENKLVAHTLGAIEDKKETNSKEAFIHSWENGYKSNGS